MVELVRKIYVVTTGKTHLLNCMGALIWWFQMELGGPTGSMRDQQGLW